MKYDVIVIGAGIGGMTAALYLKRANKKVLLIEKGVLGGAINTASTVKNYPGVLTVTGPEFSMLLYDQIKDNDIEILFDTVKDIELDGDNKIIKLNDQEFITKFVVIATGKENRKLNLPNEEKLTGKGVSYCALCDAPFFKDKNVCVIGTGDSALEEALYLSTLCKKVTILAKYDYFKCKEEHLEDVKKTKNIKIIYSAMTQELLEKDDKLCGLVYKKDDELHTLKIDGVFVYIGSSPNIFMNLPLDLDKNYVKVNEFMETNIKGIYACGDCVKKSLYQLVTASSDGAIAATSIIKELNKK